MNDRNYIEKPLLTQRFEQAFGYAFQLHAHQLRKGGSVPYISHLMGVASLVLEDGGDEDAAIAALLHDAVEDQGGAAIRGEIQQRFGDRVLHIVDACTESDQVPKPPWKQRKLQALAQMQNAEPEVLRVMVADKLHNLRSIWADCQRQSNSLGTDTQQVWQRFNASRTEVLWFYGACVEAVSDRLNSPMVTELKIILNNLNQ
jgi:(p)ppGpp synthase/HD superfamily hydrolase